MNSTDEIFTAFAIGLFVGNFLLNSGRYQKAIELLKECLILLNNKVVIMGELCYFNIYMSLIRACHNAGDPRQAIEYGEKALTILKHLNRRADEGRLCGILAREYQCLCELVKAKEFLEKAVAISIDVGDREGEGAHYGNLGNVYRSLGEIDNGRKILEKALAISKEIRDRKGEAAHCGNLGNVYQSLGDKDKAKEFHEKALTISKEIGDRKGEGAHYGNLGAVYQTLGDNDKAKKCLEQALQISKEIGDREKEGAQYGNLGFLYTSLGDYAKAKEFLKKAITISIEIGRRGDESTHYGNLGSLYQSLCEYDKAKEFLQKALVISMEIGDREGEGAQYGKLGNVYQSLGDYVKAKEFYNKALAISKELGNREREETDYGSLGTVFHSLGDNNKAKEVLEKALRISKEIGDRKGEGTQYGTLGNVYRSLGDSDRAKTCLEKALAISQEIGDRKGEGRDYGNLGTVYQYLGDYDKAKELLEKAILISKEIGDREAEGVRSDSLGMLYFAIGNNEKAKECYKKSLAIATELGIVQEEGDCYFHLALLYASMMKLKEALSFLSAAVERLEDFRSFLGDHDQYKINFADENNFPYNLLVLMLCGERKIIEALLVSELGRARALADLMSAQYFLKEPETSHRLTLVDIEHIMNNEISTSIGLYISFTLDRAFLWLLKANNRMLFQDVGKDPFAALHNRHESSLQDCVESLVIQSYRNSRVLLEGEYEDRSLSTFYETDVQCQAQTEEKSPSCRLFEENEEEQDQEQEPALRSLYSMTISPVEDLLEGSEIIICPEPLLYQVPFAALMDEDERYMSEKFRIRLIPSLTTLKLIQDCPADYHSQTGVMIVGDPDVGRLDISRLPGAKEEAEMIGRLLHVQPLIGREATKQAVLQSMRSVSLIHIAAHGDVKRGEIALAPLRPINRTPQKEDFMLTMSDVSEVQLRAKLVVLSCCHSGRGEIRAEGVIGIARAFLGSGARSVLVTLRAVDDKATKEFMREFYDHLSRGESASECLHEAMKWMRGRLQYCAVRQWAPFVLIGDNVTFNFEELTRDQPSNST